MTDGNPVDFLFDFPDPRAEAFAGSSYQADLDFDRLSNNVQRVYHLLLDGQWHTPEALEAVGGARWSARVRDLRYEAWGPLRIETQRDPDAPVDSGRFLRRLVLASVTPAIHAKIVVGQPDKRAKTTDDADLARLRKRVIQLARSAPLHRLMQCANILGHEPPEWADHQEDDLETVLALLDGDDG